MFRNREYQKRANREGLRRLARELAADAFYRPAKRPDPRQPQVSRGQIGEQFRLDFDSEPLRDIFPEVYE